MPRSGFLALLGWFVAPGFFDPQTCAGIRREMQRSPVDPARILNEKHELVLDPDKRKTNLARVSAKTETLVNARLTQMLPALEKHFAVTLTGCEPPGFLIYKPGFYYGRHVDANHDPAAPAGIRERRVSISIYLNGEGDEEHPDTYSGGALAFSGTRQEEAPGKFAGITVAGEEGLLIGFNSDWPHEVQPIRRGERYSIVTWFY